MGLIIIIVVYGSLLILWIYAFIWDRRDTKRILELSKNLDEAHKAGKLNELFENKWIPSNNYKNYNCRNCK